MLNITTTTTTIDTTSTNITTADTNISTSSITDTNVSVISRCKIYTVPLISSPRRVIYNIILCNNFTSERKHINIDLNT